MALLILRCTFTFCTLQLCKFPEMLLQKGNSQIMKANERSEMRPWPWVHFLSLNEKRTRHTPLIYASGPVAVVYACCYVFPDGKVMNGFVWGCAGREGIEKDTFTRIQVMFYSLVGISFCEGCVPWCSASSAL